MSQSNRFDSIGYLEAFRDHGRFPAIHNDLFALIISEGRAARFLDLCCSTGLLGQRVMKFAGAMFVMGVDGDAKSLDAAKSHGVTIPLRHMKLGPESFGELGKLIADHSITAVVARRCLPEIMGPWPEYDELFAETLADNGVREVFLEGRVKTATAVNRLCDVDKEAKVLDSRYRIANRRGSCLRLCLRESDPESGSAAGHAP